MKSLLFFGTSTGSYFQTEDIYFEDDTGTSQGLRDCVQRTPFFFLPMPIASTLISSPIVNYHPVATTDDEPIEDVDPIALDVAMDIPLRRLERARRRAISDDYFVYLQ